MKQDMVTFGVGYLLVSGSLGKDDHVLYSSFSSNPVMLTEEILEWSWVQRNQQSIFMYTDLFIFILTPLIPPL